MKHSFLRRCAVGALAVGTLLTTGCEQNSRTSPWGIRSCNRMLQGVFYSFGCTSAGRGT